MTNTNATTLIRLLAAIELASDDDVNPDAALKLLEMASTELVLANSDERFCISEAIDSLLDGDDNLSKMEIEFYEQFMENFGLV